MKSEHCDHEYAELVEDERTGDLVSECCRCETTLGASLPALEDHWHRHEVSESNIMSLAADILAGEPAPSGPDGDVDRYVLVCGACQHMNGAVHGNYFEASRGKPVEVESDDSSFFGSLRESLCANCGAALFRYSQVVMPYRFANNPSIVNDSSGYVKDRADDLFWSGNSTEPQLSPGDVLRSSLLDLGYQPRCPCCGYATTYGDREFDFHHWDYENDTGCILCRDCHSHIHRGGSVSEQKDIVDDWKTDAIQRLHERATGKFLEINGAEEMVSRFNIALPSSSDTVASVKMMLQSRISE
jgi:hypothetical protein